MTLQDDKPPWFNLLQPPPSKWKIFFNVLGFVAAIVALLLTCLLSYEGTLDVWSTGAYCLVCGLLIDKCLPFNKA